MFQDLIDSNPLARYGGFIAPPMAFAKKHLPVDRISKQIRTVGVETPNHDLLDFFVNGVKKSPGVVTENELADLGLMVVVPASEAVYVLQICSPVLSLNLIEYDLLIVISLTQTYRHQRPYLSNGQAPCRS